METLNRTNVELDADTKISVMYLGSLEEESGEDEDNAVTTAADMPAPFELDTGTPGSPRHEATLS